jgi:hypothetical protein
MTVDTGARRWREGKVRPIPGNPPHDRLVSRRISSSLKESLRRSLPRHRFPQLQTILGAQYAFSRHVGIYLVRCGFKIKTKNQTLGWDRAASRWSAPSPGSRTCREDHAPSHRPQMSSDRLFLDRVARQHCPSPLHRHAQTTTPPIPARRKPDISTLQGIGHFYFALTLLILPVEVGTRFRKSRPITRSKYRLRCRPVLPRQYQGHRAGYHDEHGNGTRYHNQPL